MQYFGRLVAHAGPVIPVIVILVSVALIVYINRLPPPDLSERTERELIDDMDWAAAYGDRADWERCKAELERRSALEQSA